MFRHIATVAVLSVAWTAPAAAEWKVARSDHFEVYSDGNEVELRRFVVDLERFDALMRLVTRAPIIDDALPLRVFLVSDVEHVRRLSPGGRKNLAGYYYVNDSGAIAVVPRSSDSNWQFAVAPKSVLFHEYAHHLMRQYFPAGYPPWYAEGFAEYVSSAAFRTDGSVDLGAPALHRLPTLQGDGPMPLARLFTVDVAALGPREGDRFYGTAWLVTHYLTLNPARARELNAYLAAVANGQDSADAAAASFSGGLEAIEKEVKAYLRGRKIGTMRLRPGSFPSEFPISVAALPADEEALIEARMRLLSSPDQAALEEAWDVVTAALERFPDSATAHVTAAEVLILKLQSDAALDHLARALAARPGHARAHALRARLQLRMASEAGPEEAPRWWAEALESIQAAKLADTTDPLPHYLHYDYLRSRDEPIDEVAFASAVKAFTRLPHYPAFRYALADVYAARGQFSQAAELLKPLAFDAHESEGRSLARRSYEMMRELAAEEAADADPEAG